MGHAFTEGIDLVGARFIFPFSVDLKDAVKNETLKIQLQVYNGSAWENVPEGTHSAASLVYTGPESASSWEGELCRELDTIPPVGDGGRLDNIRLICSYTLPDGSAATLTSSDSLYTYSGTFLSLSNASAGASGFSADFTVDPALRPPSASMSDFQAFVSDAAVPDGKILTSGDTVTVACLWSDMGLAPMAVGESRALYLLGDMDLYGDSTVLWPGYAETSIVSSADLAPPEVTNLAGYSMEDPSWAREGITFTVRRNDAATVTAVLCDGAGTPVPGADSVTLSGSEETWPDNILLYPISTDACTVLAATVKLSFSFPDAPGGELPLTEPVYLYWGQYASGGVEGTGTASGVSAAFPLSSAIDPLGVELQEVRVQNGSSGSVQYITGAQLTIEDEKAMVSGNVALTPGEKQLEVSFRYNDSGKDILNWECNVFATLTVPEGGGGGDDPSSITIESRGGSYETNPNTGAQLLEVGFQLSGHLDLDDPAKTTITCELKDSDGGVVPLPAGSWGFMGSTDLFIGSYVFDPGPLDPAKEYTFTIHIQYNDTENHITWEGSADAKIVSN